MGEDESTPPRIATAPRQSKISRVGHGLISFADGMTRPPKAPQEKRLDA